MAKSVHKPFAQTKSAKRPSAAKGFQPDNPRGGKPTTNGNGGGTRSVKK